MGPHAEAHRRYYQDCVARWSDERYALDERFVQLTLLLDQGEDAPGPRWQRGNETLHDLGEVLAQVPEPGCESDGGAASQSERSSRSRSR